MLQPEDALVVDVLDVVVGHWEHPSFLLGWEPPLFGDGQEPLQQ